MARSRILGCDRVKFFGINYKKLILLLSHLAVISIDIVKLNFTHARVIKGNGFVSELRQANNTVS